MKTQLYCISCERMVVAEVDFAGRLFHYNTIKVSNSPDPGTRFDLEECEMKQGFSTCPPPVFDLEEYIRQNGLPSEVLETEEIYTV